MNNNCPCGRAQPCPPSTYLVVVAISTIIEGDKVKAVVSDRMIDILIDHRTKANNNSNTYNATINQNKHKIRLPNSKPTHSPLDETHQFC